MLEIQRFLIDHPTDWKDQLAAAPYNLRIEEKGNLVLFKYSQIDSNFNYEICKEARGIILERDTWKVVRLAFYKFFNLGEGHAAAIDWEGGTYATQKEDGSLISMYYYDNKWNVATNGRIDAHDAELNNGQYKTFYDLFKAALLRTNPNFDEAILQKSCTYTFELCSPFNKIVCDYPEPVVYLTCVRDNDILAELNLSANGQLLGVPTPTQYQCQKMSDYQTLVENFGENVEGIVIQDKHYNRVKLKTNLYFELHRAVNNGRVTVERAFGLIMANDHHEFLVYFPEYKDYFDNLIEQYENAKKTISVVTAAVSTWKAANPEASRKDFADWVFANYKQWRAVAFLAYDGRLNDRIENLTVKEAVTFYQIKGES